MTSTRFVALGYCLGVVGPGLAILLDGGPEPGWKVLGTGLILAGLMLVVVVAVEVSELLRARHLDREPDA